MKHLITRLLIGAISFVSLPAWSQQFLPEIELLSTKKEGYIILKNGKRISVTLEKVLLGKGAIEGIKVRSIDGQTAEYYAIDIEEMGFPPADMAKGFAALETTGSVYRAKNSDMKQIDRDMVLFYHEYLDDQKRDVLLQLLNPGFSNKIRVYHDPSAKQTSGIGIGPVMITGGLDKSYFIRKNGSTFRLKKGEYDAQFKELYADCPMLASKYPASAWRDLVRHVYDYDQSCK